MINRDDLMTTQADSANALGTSLAPPAWRRSWDGRQHAYTEFGPLTSTALCGHTGRQVSLKDVPDALVCLACSDIVDPPTAWPPATGALPDLSQLPKATAWRTSLYDQQMHGFHEDDGVFAQALCGHSAPVGQLSDEPGVLCPACAARLHDMLTARRQAATNAQIRTAQEETGTA